MLNMVYDIKVGHYSIGMLESVEVHKSVELLADTCTIVLPAAEYNKALQVEDKLHVGDTVNVKFGYQEYGLNEEFKGFLQRISTDDGNITLICEDDLYLLRKEIADKVFGRVTLKDLLTYVIQQSGINLTLDNTYSWTYEKFVIQTATGLDVLKKIQEECGADIYIKDGCLHIHPPAEKIGSDIYYDFAVNVEECELEYRKASDRKIKVVVKANLPDGKVKEIETGSTGGNRIVIKSPTSDTASMQQRGEAEVRRRCFDGYEGNLTTWLIPCVSPGDTARIHDADYEYKDGAYFVTSVTTTFSADGGKRKVELGFRLS